MTSLKIIKYDLKNGILLRWKYFIPILFLFLFQCLSVFSKYNIFITSDTNINISIGDYFFSIFKGMPLIIQKEDVFKIDIVWLVNNLIISIFISYYPHKDINSFCHMVIIKSKHRKTWWLGKCIWTFCFIIFYYACIYITILFFSVLTGAKGFLPNPQTQNIISNIQIEEFNLYPFIFTLLIIPIISVSLSMFQLLISFLYKPILGILIISIILSIPIFVENSFVISIYLMPIRVSTIFPNSIINLNHGLILSLIIIIACYIVGRIYFNKLDFLQKNN